MILSDEQLYETMEHTRADPVWFCETALGFAPWSKQREVLVSVRDHRRTAVKSGNGLGKSSIAGRVVLWWLAGGPGSIAITTSATFTQVREVLWREVAAGYRRWTKSTGMSLGELTDTRLDVADDWFALGVSTDQPDRFAGYHGERMLVVLDEASGVGEAIWEATEGLLTTDDCRLLAIGNPLRPSGSFHRAFTRDRALYNTITISALDSPNITGEPVSAEAAARLPSRAYVEERRRAWGEESPLFQVRVLGEFPSAAEDQVVPLAAVEAAQARVLPAGEPLVVACDVARFGSDETVIVTRRGARVRIAKTYVGRDTMTTVGEIVRAARQLAAEAGVPSFAVRAVVDDPGVGGGVVDRLRELDEFPVVAFNGGHAPRARDEYVNRRSEAWFELAEQLLPDLDLDDDDQLAADLVAPRYSLDSYGRRKLEPKDATKKRLGRSPDRGDAVVMAATAGASIDFTAFEAAQLAPLTHDLLDRPL